MGTLPKAVNVETHNGTKHVEIPVGWHRVKGDETCKSDDMFYNIHTLQFQTAESDDVGVGQAWFNLLIRRDAPK
jgi:hypothetical protein